MSPIEKITKWSVTPRDQLPSGVVAVGDARLDPNDLVVIFCDDVNERTIQAMRDYFQRRLNFKVKMIAMPSDADLSVLDRPAQERLYRILGQLLGK